MKRIINRPTAGRVLTLIALASIMFSFSPRLGGDSYEISVNNKVVLQEHLYGKKGVSSLTLNQDADQDQLSVYYSHCGQIGTARNIIIKDEQNKVLKEWHFADAATGTKAPMTFKVKDIVALSNGNNKLNLFYSSKELPKGQLLAAIQLTKDNKTALNE